MIQSRNWCLNSSSITYFIKQELKKRMYLIATSYTILCNTLFTVTFL